MFDAAAAGAPPAYLTTFSADAAERSREAALRERFARFWNDAAGTPRAIYDEFIAASPMVDGVAFEEVNEREVRGWWARPAQARPKRSLLYLHGGGYVVGSARAYRGFASQLAGRARAATLVIDYPLAPEATLPAAPQAALAAWQWLLQQGYEEIAIAGDSAGGGLSLVTLARLAAIPAMPQPVAGVVFSPWTDLAFTGASMTDPAVIDPLIGYDYLRDCARKYLGPLDARDPLASPLHGPLRGLPPLLVQVGSDELLLDDSRQYAARAAQAGADVRLEVWQGMHHVFQLDVGHIASSSAALDRAGAFLDQAFHQQ